MALLRRKPPTVSFEDMPAELRCGAEPDLQKQRWKWLRRHKLAVVDYMSWEWSQTPAGRIPARRKDAE